MLFFQRPSAARNQQKKNSSRQFGFETCERRDLLAADLAVDITDGGASVAPGAEVNYDVSFKNNGDEIAAGAQIKVQTPRATAVNVDKSSEGWVCEGQECTLTVGDLASGADGQANLVLAVSDELPTSVRSISVRARITSETSEFRLRNNSDGSTTPIDRAYNDLRFDINDGGASVTAGQTVTYNINYNNASENVAPEASIKVELPEATTFSPDGSSEGWVCEGQTCSLKIGDVAAKAGGEAKMVVAVPADLPAEVRRLKIVGEISSAGLDARPRNNVDTSTTPIRQVTHDLTLDIHDSRAKTAAGETVAYTVTYGNRGVSAATNATISVEIPAETTLNAAASSDGWKCEGQVCTLSVGDVAAKEKGESKLALNYADELPSDVRNYRVRASIAAESGVDQRLGNNKDDAVTPVRGDKHDLRLRITDGGARVAVGGSVTYAITYQNGGDVTAEGAVVTAMLPEHTVVVLAESSDGWKCEDGVCTLEVGDVAVGAEGEATIAVQVSDDLPDEVRSLRINAEIQSATGVDKYARNNSDPAVTPIEREYHDLRMKITDNGARVGASEGVTYDVSWKNRGAHPAVGSTITVEIPEFTSFNVEGSSEGWKCEGQTCTLAVGDVAAGAEGSAKISLKLPQELPDQVNHVRVDATMAAATGFDWYLRNNSDPSTTPINRDYHDLRMNFHDRKATVAPGGNVVYFANYQNRGQHVATGASIRIEVPEFMTFDAATSNEGWVCEAGVCTLAVGDVEPGAAAEAAFGVKVADDLPEDLSKLRIWASINADSGADSRTRNDQNAAVTPIERPAAEEGNEGEGGEEGGEQQQEVA